jgi:hypothetical protein
MKRKSVLSIFKKNKDKPGFTEKPNDKEIELKEKDISSSIEENLKIFKSLYSVPDNIDLKIREFTIPELNKRAFIIYFSSMSDAKSIQEGILEKLLLNSNKNQEILNIVSHQSVSTKSKIDDILQAINVGNTALFIEEENQCYIFDTSNAQSRSVEKPTEEVTLKGPKEAFNEKALSNISLIRKKISNENLIVESTKVSKRSNNTVYIVYEKDIVNDELLKEVKERLKRINADSVQNLSLLEQYIEDRPRSLFPSILYTERPDRAASFIEDGHVVLLMDNSPSCLVLPSTFWGILHNPEEHYLRLLYGNFTRILRMFAMFIAIFTSGIYVAITNYHSEMVPPDLLMAIAGTRERVPFPAVIEVLIMEIAFELIREAGLRVPTPIGPTIGIVGALILGQAAVQANIISPIVIIVVALSGLSSFAISDLSLNFTIRLSRFLFLFSAGFMGIYGMTAVFMLGIFYMITLKSFGVPYLAPMTPKFYSSKDIIIRKLPMSERFRPGYLKPKDMIKRAEDN